MNIIRSDPCTLCDLALATSQELIDACSTSKSGIINIPKSGIALSGFNQKSGLGQEPRHQDHNRINRRTQAKTMVDGPKSPAYMLFFSNSMTSHENHERIWREPRRKTCAILRPGFSWRSTRSLEHWIPMPWGSSWPQLHSTLLPDIIESSMLPAFLCQTNKRNLRYLRTDINCQAAVMKVCKFELKTRFFLEVTWHKVLMALFPYHVLSGSKATMNTSTSSLHRNCKFTFLSCSNSWPFQWLPWKCLTRFLHLGSCSTLDQSPCTEPSHVCSNGKQDNDTLELAAHKGPKQASKIKYSTSVHKKTKTWLHMFEGTQHTHAHTMFAVFLFASPWHWSEKEICPTKLVDFDTLSWNHASKTHGPMAPRPHGLWAQVAQTNIAFNAEALTKSHVPFLFIWQRWQHWTTWVSWVFLVSAPYLLGFFPLCPMHP